MFYSFREIIQSLPIQKNSKSSLWVKMIIRKISFLFTFIFINIGCSAWMASILSVFFALGGCVALCFNSAVAQVIGVVLIEFWLIMDCVDGNIARVKKTNSEMGEFIDALSGYYVTGFVYLAIGVSAYFTTSFLEYKLIFLILGAVSTVSGLLARTIHQKFIYTLLIQQQQNAQLTNILFDKNSENKKSINYIRNRVDKELGISGAFMPFLIIAAIFRIYDFFTMFYFVFQVCGLIAATVYYSFKAR